MLHLQKYINQPIQVTISGELLPFEGIMIDKGSDIIVLYDGEKYMYISSLHIQHLTPLTESLLFENLTIPESLLPQDMLSTESTISLRKTLQVAKGQFIELALSHEHFLYGYVTHIMNDYFVFLSPVYQTLYIPFHHVKYLIPYQEAETPYGLERERLSPAVSKLTLARTFSEQLKKLKQHIVLLDLGIQAYKVGKLTEVTDSQIELITARNQHFHFNLYHIKTVHFPYQNQK
ncbi:DUF2642 domain-containing protein [Bacillus multifaciens]|uniref:DUF2642 domain-containing protein n=1 Tax=Bacillus multifaciens TaxID=3068506 RepID=UPI002740FA6F|nr:DUF2642 domain-containing protein [Bacillus sp. WLY-B-L8]MDP7979482.1 DUF2642 domain-containing protein [Bacillus sp. WLY-B-L8]HDX9587124.1 DUF2642 domain-containing protein [Bacillus pseudomycoides]